MLGAMLNDPIPFLIKSSRSIRGPRHDPQILVLLAVFASFAVKCLG